MASYIEYDVDAEIEELNHLLHDEPEPDYDDLAAQAQLAQAKPPAAQIKKLNQKAMSVQLVTRKPTTSFNDDEAAKAAQSALGDNGISASTKLFKDKTNPVRQLLSEVAAVYQFHKQNTIPYVDRGPRLLPVERYDEYRTTMRRLVLDVENSLSRLKPNYDRYVAQDIAFRNRPRITILGEVEPSARAKVEDYPTADEFAEQISLTFTFAPLPDNSHWLFDVDDEDRAALDQNASQVYKAALAYLKAKVETPLVKLIEALSVPAGTKDDEGKRQGIFRDTKVTNVLDATASVRSLAMGDTNVLEAVTLVEQVIAPIAVNPDVVRQSPVVREQAAAKLKAVADRFGGFFGV